MGIKTRPRHDSFTDPPPTWKLWDPVTVLEITNPIKGHITCVGYAPSCRRRCQNPINRANRESAFQLLEALSYIDTSTIDISERLRQLARLTLCVRYHQSQDEKMIQSWSKQISQQQKSEIKTETSPYSHHKTKVAGLFSSFAPPAGQRYRMQYNSPSITQEERVQKRREEQERDREKKLREENQRKKYEEEKQRKKYEEEKQRKKRDEEQQRKKCAEENQRRKEQEARDKEAREWEERNERIRQRAEKMRAEREQKAKAQAEKEREEWDKAWLRYALQWEDLKNNGEIGTSEKLLEIIPWPVKSGDYKDVSGPAVEEFFRKAIPQDADDAKSLGYLRAECLKWHADRIPRMFGAIKDEALTSLFNTVAQVVVRMTVEKRRQQGR